MSYNELLQHMLDNLDLERFVIRRIAIIVAPLLLFALIALTIQMTQGGWVMVASAMGVIFLMAQLGLLTKPTLERLHSLRYDARIFLASSPQWDTPIRHVHWGLKPIVQLCGSNLAAAALSLCLFVPATLADGPVWRQLTAVALGIVLTGIFCQRFLYLYQLIGQYYSHFTSLLHQYGVTHQPNRQISKHRSHYGLLNPTILDRINMLPLPLERLSPAALALIRVESYLLLRDAPTTTTDDLHEAIHEWTMQAQRDEHNHWLLPTVGGKIYLPITTHSALFGALSKTTHALGMNGAYSATLGVWRISLPSARSYAVAARLIDALIALGLLPQRQALMHHLTIAGNLGHAAIIPTLLHLLAAPLIFEPNTRRKKDDDRSFISRSSGILDDLDHGMCITGSRTDFTDGFIYIEHADMCSIEHLMAHNINLRIKQLLAWAIYAAGRDSSHCSTAEVNAAKRYAQLYTDLTDFLSHYDLQGALQIRQRDGRWSDQWPYLHAISEHKHNTSGFLETAQRLRNNALNDLERIAIHAMGYYYHMP